MKMRTSKQFLWVLVFSISLCYFNTACNQTASKSSPATEPVVSLIDRWFPERSSDFIIEEATSDQQRDYFTIESVGSKIKIVGNSPLSMASGFGYYLTNYCHISLSIQGENSTLPRQLPQLKEKIRKVTPFEKRYLLNYCTFGYTMAWWNWERWEKFIDWMAMHGINMPLAITGQEAVWQKLLKEYKFTDLEIHKYLSGPAFLPWQWMGNIDGLAGPLPENWIRRHETLGKKILERERAFGMKPVLQGFTGQVPKSMKDKYPNIKLVQTTDWAGMPGTYRLDPQDPLFNEMGKRFIEIQTQLYGTDHLYDADCFNEVNPPSSDTSFIRKISASVFKSMTDADPKAIWVMQGWFLYWQKDFWKEPQARALLDAIPSDRLILLDLYGEKYPVWNETESFYGKPWIWNIICNLGQQVNLSGDLAQIYKNYVDATTSPSKGDIRGIGMMMEGFGYNPVVQEFICSLIWTPKIQNLSKWMADFATRRYGVYNANASEAWQEQLNSVYSHTASGETVVTAMPGNELPAMTPENPYGAEYNTTGLFKSVEAMLAAADALKNNENYQFDLIHIVREILSLKANQLLNDVQEAEKSHNLLVYKEKSRLFVDLLQDMDRLLAADKHFLLGKWLSDARKWGDSNEEKDFYEWNARSIITLWQPSPDSYLNDYASKQWNGLIGDYYLYRWKRYFNLVQSCMEKGVVVDKNKFLKDMKQWEYSWIQNNNSYPEKPRGNAIEIASELYTKYSASLLP